MRNPKRRDFHRGRKHPKKRGPTHPHAAARKGVTKKKPCHTSTHPHGSRTPEQIARDAWTSAAIALEQMIPDAVSKAIAGKPATLRLITRFFRAPRKPDIGEAKFLSFISNVARPDRPKENASEEEAPAALTIAQDTAAPDDPPADRCAIPEHTEAPDHGSPLPSQQTPQPGIDFAERHPALRRR